MKITANPFIKPSFGVSVYLMTPTMAQYLFTNYGGNIRNESKGGISKIATSMKNNRFFLTGDCIKVEKNTGLILDGHHRLLAVVESGVEVLICIAWGVEREALLAIDTGIPRNAGICIAASQNESKENNTLWRKRASVANMCIRTINNFRLHDMPDAAAKLAYYNTHSASIDAVIKSGINRKTNGSGFRAAMALYFQENPFKAKTFYDHMTNATSSDVFVYGGPENALHKFFAMESRGQGGESLRMKKDFYATRRAIEAHVSNGKLLIQNLKSFE